MARFFFHLIDSKSVIRDHLGALANDLAAAHRAAAEVIAEFKSEEGKDASAWHDWKLVVTEENTKLTLILPLTPDFPAASPAETGAYEADVGSSTVDE